MMLFLRILLAVFLVTAFSDITTNNRCQAWIPHTDTVSGRRSYQRYGRSRFLWTVVTPPKMNKNDEDDQAVLSDLDARVLQEMLQSDKLDVEKEANMKKLLERGIKKEDDVNSKYGKKSPDQESKKRDQTTSLLSFVLSLIHFSFVSYDKQIKSFF